MHIDHPSVIKFYCSFRNLNKLYILLEYCAHGSLQDFLILKKTLSLPLTRHMAAELVDALDVLRKNQIVHRDLKPGNIVLDKDYHLKLIDFGTCRLLNPEIIQQVQKTELIAKLGSQTQADMFRTFSLVGTEDYISPEVLQDVEVSYPCDLWSLGVILYQMLAGCTPFKGKTPEETY
jgi:serine/threonine protein kinase